MNIVSWNGDPYIQLCWQALFQQTYQDVSVTVVDNGSEDETVFLIEPWERFGACLMRNLTNEGFGQAHNKAISPTNSEFVLASNPDVLLTPPFMKNILAGINSASGIGSHIRPGWGRTAVTTSHAGRYLSGRRVF